MIVWHSHFQWIKTHFVNIFSGKQYLSQFQLQKTLKLPAKALVISLLVYQKKPHRKDSTTHVTLFQDLIVTAHEQTLKNAFCLF